ncbi:hypothetical protein WJW27_002732 [Escherichia coli]
MDVLATNFKRNTEEREGYLSISDVVDDNFKQYIFNSAIKLKCTKDAPDRSFTKWIAYWEDSPIAIEMTVITTVLETGYIKAIVVDKKVRSLDEINPYPARNSKVFGFLVEGKFMIEKDAKEYVINMLQTPTEKKKVVDQNAIDSIKKAWGLK